MGQCVLRHGLSVCSKIGQAQSWQCIGYFGYSISVAGTQRGGGVVGLDGLQ